MRFTIAFVLLIFASPLLGQQWEITQETNMPKRISNNAVVEGFLNGVPHVYSFSGIDSTKSPAGINNQSFRYNTITKVWDEIAPLPDDQTKIAAGASYVNGIIYIMGGYHVFSDFSEISSDKVHRYDVDNNEYLADGSSIPLAIDDHVQAVWRDSLIYLITGWSDFANVANVQIYNPSEDQWLPTVFTPNNSSYKAFGASGTIIGDTIYYFGGAISTGNFPITSRIRKGIINPENPSEINWSVSIIDNSVNGYRTGATSIGDTMIWIGGSETTYNFDGIAYNGSGGVEPVNRSFEYVPSNGWYATETYQSIPMDIRGVANIAGDVKYLAGGMLAGQEVSNQTFRLLRKGNPITSVEAPEEETQWLVQPNPFKDLISIQKIDELPSEIEQLNVYDVNGMLLLRTSAQNTVNLEELNEGLYFLEIIEDGKSSIQKIIKLK